VRIIWVILIYLKGESVIPVQSIPCAELHESPAVLQNACYGALGEAFFRGDPLKLSVGIQPRLEEKNKNESRKEGFE